MNAGAFDHEEEILLGDGTQFSVLYVLEPEYEIYELQGYGAWSVYKSGNWDCGLWSGWTRQTYILYLKFSKIW